ncbi:MAG: hypothetical protein ACOY58_01060, partial [Candidatus Micrarchaeota archaeon]
FTTSTRKADYLGYRAMGFSVREACDLVPITFKTLLNWRRQDEEFAKWEGGRLAELQSTIADDVLRFAFLRNMRLVLRIDGRLFERRLYDPNGMTSDDRKDYREAAKRYSATDLIAIEKATSREEEGQGEAGSGGLTVIVEGDMIVGEEARRAASRALLERFMTNRKMIEGEAQVVSDGDGDEGTDGA